MRLVLAVFLVGVGLGFGLLEKSVAQELTLPLAPSITKVPMDATKPVEMPLSAPEVTVFDWAFNPELFKKLWEGSLEFGINGTDGNSENFKFRIAGSAKRETEVRIIKLDILYSYASLNGTESENRSLSTLKHEWLFGNSPWSIFVLGTLETDAFRAFDARVAAHTGIAYAWIKNDITQLKTRIGAGFSHEIGGPDNTYKPELLLGGDFEHKLTERQKLVASVDVFPNFQNFSDYRTQLKASWEVLIDPAWNLTLKLGIVDRFDSTPEGKKKNDFEYFGVLMWKF